MWLAMGVLGALVERASSGKGQYLDISMMDCAVALLENAVMRYLWDGQVPQRLGRRHPQVPGTGAFQTADGYLTLTSLSEANWPQLCKGLERPDLSTDPRFATVDLRHTNRNELDSVLADHVKSQTTRYWLDRLEPLGALASPVNTIPQMLEEPSVRDRGLIQYVEQQQGTVMPLVASPLRMSRTPASIRFAAPLLAQHEHQILNEWLGVEDDEFTTLHERGAFAAHA
jgi:CoA:oxalate CoA-transferase